MSQTAAQNSTLSPNVLLRATEIAKSFGAVCALRGVTFELRGGEVHALLGENGAGKSTFTKIVTGILRPDSGELLLSGQPVRDFTPNTARASGIAAIYQQPSLFPHLSVAENIALVLEQGRPQWKINWKQRLHNAEELTAQLGARIDPLRVAGSLSMAEQQIVEIAKAVGTHSRILFMDEPTALLTEHEAENLFRIIRKLREQGVGIVYISHRLEEIQALADRMTVLRDGQTIACRKTSEVSRSEIINLMVGRSVDAIYPKRIVPLRETMLEVSRLHNVARGLNNISFSIRAGEILGFAGLVGSGRTELAETLFGITPSRDTISVQGEKQIIDNPRRAVQLGLGYLPEDRRRHGLIMDMAIADNISIAEPRNISQAGLINRTREDRLAGEFVSRLSIKTAGVRTPSLLLSGGNQQKVALARWLAINPRIMILDEPTQGVDVGSKAEIHEIITAMAESGVAIILISSELPEIIGMCDRVAVFHQKTIVATLDRSEATPEKIMSFAFGHTAANNSIPAA